MLRLWVWAVTLARLGPGNLARVAVYRLALRLGLHPVQRLWAPVAAPPFLRPPAGPQGQRPRNGDWDRSLVWFGWFRQPLPAGPPDWFANPFSAAPQPDATLPWWQIADFGAGDIKGQWELSRFDWVLIWAMAAALGDQAALTRLNGWLADWARANPPFRGPQWKCGQETAFRVIHLATAAWVLGQDDRPEQGLVDLLAAHLCRIAATLPYAVAQQNNHATSEALALFVGGSLLQGRHPQAACWAGKGLRQLERLAQRLILPDGTFSQYSVSYHRLMLDSYALAEAWRRHRALPAFSGPLHLRLCAATDWLWSLTDPATGDAPNIGATDGARLLPITAGALRDFRPSVHLAAALFRGADAFGPGPWTAPLAWLGIPPGQPCARPPGRSHPDGGFDILRIGSTMAVMRVPRFRFRPGHADALHVDLWHDGVNLFRDGGSYSYNAPGADWFASTAAHNTITFDNRDQMPRLGRFLFGAWLRADAREEVRAEGETLVAGAAYTDAQGARHQRRLVLGPRYLICDDVISGRFATACLRWRLVPGDWQAEGHGLRGPGMVMGFVLDGRPVTPSLGITQESRHYGQKVSLPLAFLTVDRPARLRTWVRF